MSRKNLPSWLIPVLIVAGCGVMGVFLLLGVVIVLLLQRSGTPSSGGSDVVALAAPDRDELLAPPPTSEELYGKAMGEQRRPQQSPDGAAQSSAQAANVNFPPPGAPPGFNGGFPPFGPPGFPPATAEQAALERGAAQPPADDDQPIALADLIERVQPAMVKISVDKKSGGRVMGSGFLFDDTNTVVTNYHVIEGAASITVRFKESGDIAVLGIGGYDQGNDLAVLKIPPAARKATPIALAPSTPRVGEKAIAIGSPQGFSFTTSEGIVSAVRSGSEIRSILRDLSGSDEYSRHGLSITNTWLQITTPISTGNSGGPLLDDRGRLIGVNTLTLATGQNLNLSISSQHVRDLVERSKQRQMTAINDLPAPRRDPQVAAAPPGRGGPPGRRGLSGRVQIKSPSGAVFDSDSWEINKTEAAALIDEKAETALLNYDSGNVLGVATHDGGVLQGFTVALYENGELMRVASYDDGSRHGKLAAWSELGDLQYFGEFFKGKNDGFCGVLVNNQIELLMEYDKGTLVWVHRVAGNQIVESFESREAAAADAETLAALDRFDLREEEIMTTEVDFRRDVRDYAQEERRARAAYLGAQKRARMQARINQRSTARDAVHRALQRTAGY